ncbi:1-phosphofructokinase family hexose kinase [Arthrobacter echini]|uniref:1-phosphofructokinase family hexose kinase n=1 Tax=Arthrobacter echini TaxID=1529066 RepID=A0A4S5E6Y4_9MICC|nr:PfkB family carbohydrate kinase [Arthrobacter echini]THJ67304.1 1-phosphofructokinase family hexose kinase [Arthrobacter echini]
MIIAVTPNPAWDVTIDAPHLQRGATNSVPPARRRAGGKGINVARVLESQGIAALALAPIGSKDLEEFAADLGTVPHRLAASATATRSTYALVESDDGVTTMVTERGHERRDEDWELFHELVRSQVPGAACLVISGSLPPGSDTARATALVRAGRDSGVPIIADLARDHLRAAAAAGADVLKPNQDELRDAVGTSDPLDGARALQDLGAGVVVVSLGSEGLVVVPRERSATVWRARTPEPLAGNPTGAGDAAVAAIASLIATDVHEPAEWARRAAAWSAAAVLAPLAGELGSAPDALERDIVLSAL